MDEPDAPVAPDPAARDRVPGLPGVHLRAREARATRAALPVIADPAALAGARLGTRRVAQPCPGHVPCRSRRDHPVPPRRRHGCAANDITARGRARGDGADR